MNIRDTVTRAFAAAFDPLSPGFEPTVLRCSNPDFGDFQCTDPLRTAKDLGMKPRDLCEIARERVAAELGRLATVSVAGPGYVNVGVSDAALSDDGNLMLLDALLGVVQKERRRIVIDFGGLNVAKPLHVGHLRSFALGESLRRILLECGHDVVSDIHLGDWGLQMGKLLLGAALKGGFERGDPKAAICVDDLRGMVLGDLRRLYKAGSQASDEDAAALELARQLTLALQSGDALLTAAWSAMRSASLAAIKQTAAELGAHFDLWLGESDADASIAPMIEDLVARGIASENDGAVVVPLAGDGLPDGSPPLILQKRDGAALYGTTDLATLRDRIGKLGADEIVYCTDDRQSLHMASVFAAAVKDGYASHAQLRHAAFGTVRGPDGKPFKTRSGEVIALDDLIGEAAAAAAVRIEDGKAARHIGLSALKFADLAGPRRTGAAPGMSALSRSGPRSGAASRAFSRGGPGTGRGRGVQPLLLVLHRRRVSAGRGACSLVPPFPCRA